MYHNVLFVWIVLTQNLKHVTLTLLNLTVKFSVENLKNETTDIYIFTSVLSFKFVNYNYKDNLNPSTYSAKHFNQDLFLYNKSIVSLSTKTCMVFDVRNRSGLGHQKNTQLVQKLRSSIFIFNLSLSSN